MSMSNNCRILYFEALYTYYGCLSGNRTHDVWIMNRTYNLPWGQIYEDGGFVSPSIKVTNQRKVVI